jgi:hypothetical protein
MSAVQNLTFVLLTCLVQRDRGLGRERGRRNDHTYCWSDDAISPKYRTEWPTQVI